MHRLPHLVGLAAAFLFVAGCSGYDDDSTTISRDGGTRDAGTTVRDGGFVDAGEEERDGGFVDAGTRDGGTRDGGVVECGPLETDCNGVCADVFADDAHCGGCNLPCTGGDVCLNGACGPMPPTVAASVPFQVIAPGCRVTAPHGDVAVDPSARIFVAFDCPDGRYTARSDDLGVTFEAPVAVGIPTIQKFGLHAPAPDVLYAAAGTTGGALVFAKSTDGGATWSSPRVIDAGPIERPPLFGFGPYVTSWRNHVYLAITDDDQSELRIWRNDALGEGAFSLTTIPYATASGGGLLVHPATGDLYVFVDAPLRAQMFRSTDRGETFTSLHNLGGLGIGAEVTLAGPDVVYYACSFVLGAGACRARIDLATGAVEPLPVPPDTRAPSPGGAGVVGAPDGSAYSIAFGVGANMTPNGTLALSRYVLGSAVIDATREVTTSTGTADINVGWGLGYLPETNGVAFAFTSSVGAAVGVEAF